MEPFDACWHRIDRAAAHRKAAAGIWNAYIEDDPHGFVLDYEGEGKFAFRAREKYPPPPEMAVVLGEWLYNLRCALDYAVYSTAICVSRTAPPPGGVALQFPIYDSPAAYRKNEYRLKPLASHHRDILESMQPYRHEDPDTSALGWINNLARIDRHRRLSVITGYLAEVNPIIGVPKGCTVDMRFGKRVYIDGQAEIADFTVTPWQDDWKIDAHPRVGLDPDIAEWAESPFWRPIDYNKRLRMLLMVVESMVATLEYDCLGYTREAEMLTEEFRAECDARRDPEQVIAVHRLAPKSTPASRLRL